jgi:hypothetical protein
MMKLRTMMAWETGKTPMDPKDAQMQVLVYLEHIAEDPTWRALFHNMRMAVDRREIDVFKTDAPFATPRKQRLGK